MILLTTILLIFVHAALQASSPSSPTYEAGVVEFNYGRDSNSNPTLSLEANLLEYLKIMTFAPSNLDIIVFPEMTLNQLETAIEIPEPAERISACFNESYPTTNLVKQISCAATNFQRYVVVNMVTKATCPDSDMIAQNDPRKCRDSGFSYYNTNVVFDRNGMLISRYRKYNLFGERVDKPYKPTSVYFDTDFGVRFGHFICFDLQFQYPALELVRYYNITDIIFTSMWYSELPFLTAVQLQQNWAYAHNVNLLASGANSPSDSSTGTGIYAGRRGSLISVMEGKASSQLFAATVPKRGLGDDVQIEEHAIRYTRFEMTPLDLWRDQLEPYSIRFLEEIQLELNTTNTVITVECHEDLCCTFEYNVYITPSERPYYRFALAVFHGKRTFSGLADGGVMVCAVIACQSHDIATCGVRNETFDFVHHWHKLKISGQFPYGNEYNYMPNTLDSSIMPFGVNEIIYEQKTIPGLNSSPQEYNIIMNLNNSSRREFYTFGIYGRDFNLDTASSAGISQITLILNVMLAALFIIDFA